MKKANFLLIVVLAALLLLTSCVQNSAGKVRLSANSYRNFSYKQTDYSITNTEIPESQITGALSKFRKLVIVDRDNQRLMSKITEKSTTLAFANLYETSKGLVCIGINSKFFQVLPTTEVTEGKLLNIQNFPKTNDDDFSINNTDLRKINNGSVIYKITDKPVSEEELDDYLGVLGKTKLFNPETGKEIPRSKWGEIDWDGSKSKDKRETWNYGEIDTLKNYSQNQAIAVEINDEFRLAERVEN